MAQSKHRAFAVRILPAVGVAIAPVLALLASSAFAQTATWQNPSGGDWFNGVNWSTGDVPDAPGESAVITGSDAFAIVMTHGLTADVINLADANATLRLQSNSTYGGLTLGLNSLSNVGTLELTSADAGWQTNLTLQNGGTLNNSGVLRIEKGAGGLRNITGNVSNASAGRVEVNTDATHFGGTWTNAGTIGIADNAALTVFGGTFAQQAGNVGYASGATAHTGKLVIDSGVLNFGGGSIGVPVELRGNNPTVSTTIANGGGAVITQHAINATINTDLAPNTRLNVEGSDLTSSVALKAVNSFTNHGTLVFTSINNGWQSSLQSATPTGALFNDGSLRFEVGAGGLRDVQAGSFENLPLSTTAVNTDTSIHASFTNRGDIAIANGKTLSLGSRANGGGYDVYLKDGGDIRPAQSLGSGKILFSTGTFHFQGGYSEVAFDLINNATLDPTTSDGLNSTFRFRSSGTLGLVANPSLAPHTTVVFESNDTYGGGQLDIATDFTNRGIIRLTSADNGWQSRLHNLGGQFTNAGVINVDHGAGGYRELSLTNASGDGLLNSGTINANTTLTQLGVLGNTGTIHINNGSPWFASQNSVITNNGGSIVGDGYIELGGGTFDHLDGQIGVPVFFKGGANNVLRARSAANPNYNLARFYLRSATSLDSDIGTGDVVTIEGNDVYGGVAASSPGALGIGGGLHLSSVNNGWSSTLTVGSGGTDNLFNFGVLSVDKGAGGLRTINAGILTNFQLIYVEQNLTLNASLINAGFLMTAPDTQITLTQGKSFANAGLLLLGSRSQINIPIVQGAVSGKIGVGAGSSLSGSSLDLSGSGAALATSGAGATATFATISVDAAGRIVATGGGNIVATGGGNIVAQGAGNIVAQGAGNIVAQGAGNRPGNRSGGGDAAFDPTLVAGDGTFTAGNVMINAGAELRPGDALTLPDTTAPQDGGVPDVGDPQLMPAGARGTLHIDGNLVMQPGSGLRVTLDNSGADRVSVNGNVTVGGVVNFEHVAGFTPTARSEYSLFEVTGTDHTIEGGFSGVGGYDLGNGLWLGQRAGTPATFVVTIAGDADLSFGVSFSDLVVLAQHYNQSVSIQSGAGWQWGDFNYSGKVDFTDLVLLAQHYNHSLPAAGGVSFSADFASDWAIAQALVPEPGCFALLGALVMLRRSRK